ncbi:MAG: MFS transporter [Defluviitaleaceae bacterium]|nr:MFS transporter [Defluviitaleaceae bacterium]
MGLFIYKMYYKGVIFIPGLFRENSTFRAFLFFKTFSAIGVNVFAMFIIWVVHALFENPMYTGLAGFMATVPGVVSFISGPFIDRFSKIALLRAACFMQFCVVMVLIVLPPAVLSGGVWVLLLAVLIFNVARVVALPAGVALLPKIVAGDDLVKANSLTIIWGVFGGLGISILLFVLMDRVDFRAIYAINAVILLIALISSAKLHIAETTENKRGSQTSLKAYFSELKDGLVFVGRGTMLHLMLALVGIRFASEIVNVNLPMFVDVNDGGASGYVLLMIFGTLGGIAGPLISNPVGRKFRVPTIIIVGYLLAGASWFIFIKVATVSFWGAMPIMAIFGMIAVVITIFAQTLTQKLPPPQTVARVSTIKTSLYNIAAAIGALLGGFLGRTMANVNAILSLQSAAYVIIAVLLCFSVSIKALPKIKDV